MSFLLCLYKGLPQFPEKRKSSCFASSLQAAEGDTKVVGRLCWCLADTNVPLWWREAAVVCKRLALRSALSPHKDRVAPAGPTIMKAGKGCPQFAYKGGSCAKNRTDLVGSEFQTAKINFSLFKRLAGKISFYYKLVTDSPAHQHHQRGAGARSILGIKARREFSFGDWVRGNDIFDLLVRQFMENYVLKWNWSL